MCTILFSYRIVYKVATCYTPYQLVYGLHLLMPIIYVLPAINGNHINAELSRVLTTKITKLENLHDNRLEVKKNVGTN